MRKKFLPAAIALLIVLFRPLISEDCVANESSPPPIYTRISNLYRPTNEDYRLLQKYLSSDERNLSQLGDFEWIAKHIFIIGTTEQELPQSGRVSVNCTDEYKENCVILYASFNRNYPLALHRLLDIIKRSDFQGHVIYRIGGWPNTEGGDLTLAHVPYAFKVCAFKEAKRLGYKRCLWLDTSLIPVVSLNTIFKMIEAKGYFTVDCGGITIGPYMTKASAAAFGLSLEQTKSIPSCSAGIFGIDFTNPTGSMLIDKWYQAAHDKDAFFSPRSDQNCLSIILYQAGISDFISLSRIPHTECGQGVQPDSLFILDRIFTHHKQQ